MSGAVVVDNGVYAHSSGSPPKLGDTQIFPSQVFADHLGTKWAPHQDWDFNSLPSHATNDANDTGARTYATGDTGHVKLVQTQQSENEAPNSQLGDDDGSSDELAETSQTRPITATSPPFLSPTTPALAGNKRDRRGNVVEAITRTPAPDLAAALTMAAPQQNFLGLSQVFNQTQADSSPFLGRLRSDPIFERPSPDMRVIQTTSPSTLSSPIQLKKPPPSTAVSDSRLAYEPMKHSQERRRQRSMTMESESDDSNGEDELGDDSAQQKLARKRSMELQKKKSMKEFANFVAPVQRLGLQSGRKSRRGGDEDEGPGGKEDVIVISDDVHEDEDLNEAYSSSVAESVDEYDELSQAVIRSDPAAEHLDDNVGALGREDSQELDELETSQDQPTLHDPPAVSPKANASRTFRRTASSPVRQSQKEALIHTVGQSFPSLLRSNSSKDSSEQWNWPKSLGSQSSAIADSQPMLTVKIADLIPPPRPVMPSSITSRGFLSESQGFSLSSTTRIGLGTTHLAELEAFDGEGSKMDGDDLNVTIIRSSPPQLFTSPTRRVESRSAAIVDNLLLGDEVCSPYPAASLRQEQDMPSANARARAIDASQTSKLRAASGLSQSIPETSPAPTPAKETHPRVTSGEQSDPFRMSLGLETAQNDVSDEGQPNKLLNDIDATETFATARTHQSASNKNSATGSRPSNHNTPQRPQIRKFTDIAHDLPPPGSVEEGLLHVNILDQDDIEFHAAIEQSSPADEPPTKRPRRANAKRSQTRHVLNVDDDEIQPPQDLFMEVTNGTTTFQVDTLQALPASPRAAARTSAPAAVVVSVTRGTEGLVTSDSARLTGKLRRRNKTGPSTACTSSPRKQAKVIETKPVEPPIEPIPDVPTGPNEVSTAIAEEPSTSERNPPAEAEAQPTSDMTRPERVLAKFRGHYMAYYPATCLGPSTNQMGCLSIRFDDGTMDEVDVKYVIHFELRKGDIVRIDIPKLKSKSWVVYGLEKHDILNSPDSTEYPKTDIHGHNIVCLKAKPRQSLYANGAIPDTAVVKFPLASVYIPTTMTVPFKDRYYRQQTFIVAGTRLQTPVAAVSMPTTPSSRGRGNTFGTLGTSANFEALNDLAGSKSGLFSNMAFAISYSPQEEAERNRIRRLLQGNGAQLLNEGFDELFEVPNQPIVSPSKPARNKDTLHEAPLALANAASTLGFAALIADAHSRRAKYMQALALNLPCLSGRWVIDSCTHGKVLPWDRYLLPAGESSFLGGAVRSRTFPTTQSSSHDPTSTSLRGTLEHRPKMLAGKDVMLVMGESKADEKRKAYLFLTLALGAERVQRVKGINAAKTFLQQDSGQWDWVYVGDGKLAEAKKELHGLVHEARDAGKKRKRADSADSRGSIGGQGKKAKLIGDEFVIQSLILGALMEDD